MGVVLLQKVSTRVTLHVHACGYWKTMERQYDHLSFALVLFMIKNKISQFESHKKL